VDIGDNHAGMLDDHVRKTDGDIFWGRGRPRPLLAANHAQEPKMG
jgi:hypothetical protein